MDEGNKDADLVKLAELCIGKRIIEDLIPTSSEERVLATKAKQALRHWELFLTNSV